jgi:hypothetical protein
MTRSSVQSGYYDGIDRLYPGQIADFGTSQDNSTDSYPAETEVIAGRGVVKGAAITTDANTNPMNQPAPYKVKAPVGASVSADFLGIAVRTEACTNSSDDEAAYASNTMATVVVRSGTGSIIGAKANVAVAAGDPVYMSVDAAQAPNLPVGEFTNTNAAGVTQITGATWYAQAAAGTVGRIEL